MCNPRRIEVTATRHLAEAWTREVQRAVRLSALVNGEARVRQSLATVGAPALDALEERLRAGIAGWERFEGGYRHAVRGGYVEYRPDDQSLEIVAVASEAIEGWGEVVVHLEGQLQEEIAANAGARYYDDGYGGRTQEVAEREARAGAERELDEQVRRRMREVAEAAEAEHGDKVRSQAEAVAKNDLERQRAARAQALERQAQADLTAVGAEARLAFHRILALGYRDALLALARARGASGIQCSEQGDSLEIEFTLPD